MHADAALEQSVPSRTARDAAYGRRVVVAISILTLAAAWRLIGIQGTKAWRDEAVTLIHLQDSWWQMVTQLPFVEDTPPLFFLLLKAWAGLFTTEWTQRLLPVVFGVAAVAMIMRLAESLRPGCGWVAGLLAAFSPVPVHYSQELRVYSLLMLLVALCLWAAEGIVREPRSARRHFLWALFAVLAAHCHAIGVFVFPMTGAYLLVRLGWSRKGLALSPWSAVTWLAGCAPMFAFNIYWAMQHKQTGWWIDPLTSTTALGLLQSFTGALTVMQWIQEALYPRLIGVFTWASSVFIFGLYAVLILAALWDRRVRGPALALLSAFAVFAGLMFATSLVGVPNMIDRTLLPAWVPILVLLGIAAAPMTSRPSVGWIRTGSVVVMVCLWAVGWAWLAKYSEYERRPSYAACFQWLRDRIGPDDMVVITPSWLEDSAAWYLRDVIAGEQLFTTDAPAYTGRPPRHTLAHHRITVTGKQVREGVWSDRLRQALRERQGKNFSVWLLSGYWQELIIRDPALKQLESFFRGKFKRAEKYVPKHLTEIVAQRWVPGSASTRPAATARLPKE